MNRNNLAYDISKYDEILSQDSKKSEKRIAYKKTLRHTGSPVAVVIVAIIAGLLLYTVILGKAQSADIHNQINELKSEVDILHSENVRLQTEIEGRTSLKKVEEYASEVLGMEKLDKSQIEYITIGNENSVEIPKQEENFFVKIKNSFNDFVEYIRG